MDFFSFKYKNRDDEYEDPRRDFLVKALTMGAFAAGGGWGWAGRAEAMGSQPKQLPPGRSIYRMRGEVLINGVPAEKGQLIRPNDDIETGSDSEVIFVVGKDAFIMREGGRLELSSDPVALASAAGLSGIRLAEAESSILSGLRLISGKLLSVFGGRSRDERLGMRSPTATVGIRGTGLYMESEPDRTYVCTCYGATRLATADDATSEDIVATHHDSPRYILADGAAGRRIEPAPVINHTDMELLLIEELVGRTPPFTVSGSDSDAPRKTTS
jgi:hypothetical protein